MEPKIIDRAQIVLTGFSFFGDPFKLSGGWTEENEIGRLWKRFMAYFLQQRNRIKHVASSAVFYELHVEHAETRRTGEFEVFVGVEVNRLEDVPVELSIKILPPATYAVFTLAGLEITSDWPRLIEAWFSQSGYRRAGDYGFQYYDERFKDMQHIEESVLDVYTPVER
jgi:predicted transcriptional regulator YdeE